MSERWRAGIVEARAIERLFRVRIAGPAVLAAIALVLVREAPRLLPAQGSRVEAVADQRSAVVLSPSFGRTVARTSYSGASRPIRMKQYLFLSVAGVPPGYVVARFHLAGLPKGLTGPNIYRCYWTTGDWEFLPEASSWLRFDGEWLVSDLFDPAPDAPGRYELHLRLDLDQRALAAEMLEVEILRQLYQVASFTPKVEVRTARLGELGTPLHLEVEPWGSGLLTSAVGFRVRSRASGPVPVEVVAAVEDPDRGWTETVRLDVPDITRRHSYCPEWVPVSLDLSAWRGRRVQVAFLARPVNPSQVPEFVDVYWAVGRTY